MSRLAKDGLGSGPVVGCSTVICSLCKFCYHSITRNLDRMWVWVCVYVYVYMHEMVYNIYF
jgi:hypothetical protein